MSEDLVGKRVKATMTLSTGEEVLITTGKVLGVDDSGVLVVEDDGRLRHCPPTYNIQAI